MNWIDDPKLFIGFKVLTSDVVMNIYGVERIVTNGIDSLVFILEKDGIKIKEGVDSCTLIARKIEDMTDGEVGKCIGRTAWSEDRKELAGQVPYIGFDEALYLLSIGVYPLDQSHFGHTVIDIKTLEESE